MGGRVPCCWLNVCVCGRVCVCVCLYLCACAAEAVAGLEAEDPGVEEEEEVGDLEVEVLDGETVAGLVGEMVEEVGAGEAIVVGGGGVKRLPYRGSCQQYCSMILFDCIFYPCNEICKLNCCNNGTHFILPV